MQPPKDIASWCEISRAAIERNLLRALALLPSGTRFCAVVKADAYGHGIETVVPLLMRHGVNEIGIITNDEARAVRRVGFDGHLLRLRCSTPSEARAALPLLVEEQISSVAGARVWRGLGASAPVHLSLNAGGMGRDGLELRTPEGPQIAREIVGLCGQDIRGISAHYPSHEPADLHATGVRVAEDTEWLFANTDLQRDAVLCHAGSSLTLVADARPATQMMRCGAILYGILRPDLGFEPTMELVANVCSVTPYPAGSTVGYDRSARLDRPGVIAGVSIGYANGIGRAWRDISVLIRGHRVPVVGKVSMNVLNVDVTGYDDIEVGDRVTIFGKQGAAHVLSTRAEKQAGTIMAELYAIWGAANDRYLKD